MYRGLSFVDLMTDVGTWDIPSLSTLFPDSVISHILAIKCPSSTDGNDMCMWRWTPKHTFELQSAYSVLSSSFWSEKRAIWPVIWKLKTLPVWLVAIRMRRFCMFYGIAIVLDIFGFTFSLHPSLKIWKRRNDVVFHNPVLSDVAIISCSLAWAKHYAHNAMLSTASLSILPPETLANDAPELQWACLNVDGAVSVPLNAGKIGGLIRSQNGDWVAVELVNSPLAGSSVLSLVCAIYQLRQKHWATKVIWIPRDDNRCADALAKLADPSDFSLHVYNSPPLKLDLLLCEAASRL
ncbi:hypothetical protein V6N11_026336 [Hibiscus sabdariffa]|uniref:RNase H type-1 domain-containing protein n=1 Tax=Hibiscus sabdariffa TaxID=183260 RepID=A0ABR2SVE1_9ROSI